MSQAPVIAGPHVSGPLFRACPGPLRKRPSWHKNDEVSLGPEALHSITPPK
jgi:hypothetical protein